ncbi:MAG: hypothetical protein WA918_02130 [Erythrobacter sp.]
MTRNWIVFLSAFSLAACERPNVAPASGPEPTGSAAAAQHSGPALPVGQYRLAGVDGRAINLPHAISLSVTESEIRLSSQCVRPRWQYRQNGRDMVTTPIPIPICERARYPEEDAAIAVLDDITAVRRTPENGWQLEGGGHSIAVFSQ